MFGREENLAEDVDEFEYFGWAPSWVVLVIGDVVVVCCPLVKLFQFMGSLLSEVAHQGVDGGDRKVERTIHVVADLFSGDVVITLLGKRSDVCEGSLSVGSSEAFTQAGAEVFEAGCCLTVSDHETKIPDGTDTDLVQGLVDRCWMVLRP